MPTSFAVTFGPSSAERGHAVLKDDGGHNPGSFGRVFGITTATTTVPRGLKKGLQVERTRTGEQSVERR